MMLAAVLVQLALTQAPLPAMEDPDAGWLAACIGRIESAPEAAYEDGMAWSAETRRAAGWRCAAIALVEMGRPGEGARRLEALSTPDAGPPAMRAELLSQAGNAWLLAGESARAQAALSRALTLMEEDRNATADLLIDRARAFAMQENWRGAEEDLSRSIDLFPENALALRLRAAARMNQNAFDLAVADAENAVRLSPGDVESLLTLGNAREAQRTGAPVNPQ